MGWLFFALMAPFLWAVGSVVVKFMRLRHVKSPLGYIVFIAPTAFLSLLLLFFEPFVNAGLKNALLILLSGIFAGVGYYLFIYALHEEEVSRATTLYGVTPLFVLLLATIFLNEILSPKDYVAFFLILAGTFLISAKNSGSGLRLRKGFFIIMLSSFAWAIHNVLLKIASSANFPTMMIWREAGFLLLVFGFLVFSKGARIKAKETAIEIGAMKGSFVYLAEILGMGGMVFAYLAIQRAPVSLVTLVEGFQSLFIIFLATIISMLFPDMLKEKIDKKTVSIKIVSAVLMLAGLYLIVM
jgi:drug/metabolite transporter (DMT)-like permease